MREQTVIQGEELADLLASGAPLVRQDKSGEGFYLPADDVAMQLIHALQLHMLLEIDRICREEGIEYYLLFGTLLGAKRHGGFIPWDDDIDIGILRQDFDRLLDLLAKRLDTDRFELQYGAWMPQLPIPYAKLRAKHSRFEEVGRSYEGISSGVFIDLFPLDNVPDDDWGRRRQRIDFFRTHFPRRVKHDGYKSRHLPLQAYYGLRAKQASAKLWKKNLQTMQKYGDESSKLLIAYPSARSDYRSSFMSRADMSPAVDLDFCGYPVMGPSAVEDVLVKLFGDYMQLPKPASRHGHRLARVEIDLVYWQSVWAQELIAVERQHGETVQAMRKQEGNDQA